jgi:hypothetical protein
MALFFLLDWDRYRFDKKRARTCYAKLVFFNLEICGTCGAFRYGLNKKGAGTRDTQLVFFHPV